MKCLTQIKNFLLVKWIHFTVIVSHLGSKIYMPYSRKLITGKDYHELHNLMVPGMVLVSRSDGELGNIGIPGFWSHAAIVLDENRVVEAVTSGVRVVDLVTFMMGKDYIEALLPKFATSAQMKVAVEKALEQVGKEYDFEFATSDIKKFYCSELVFYAYNFAVEYMPFIPREILGRLTVVPQDFPNADDKFYRRWTSESVKGTKAA